MKGIVYNIEWQGLFGLLYELNLALEVILKSIIVHTCTAFLVTMNEGACGVLAKKSAIGVVGGCDNNFV